jgi:hypothetical protein
LEPVIAGPVVDTEDTAQEGIQDVVDVVAKRFQRDPADDEWLACIEKARVPLGSGL